MFQIHRDLGAGGVAGGGAHDFRVFGIGEAVEAFGQRENLEGGESFAFAQDESAGFMNCADDVDDVGLGDGDNVFWLYGDVFRRVGGVHNAFDVDGGDAVETGRIVGCAGERDAAQFKTASDSDAVTRVLAEAADHRQVDVAAHVDADGLVADFIHVGDLDGDLVVCAEHVVGGRVLALGRRVGDATGDGLRRGRGSRRSWRLLRASNHHERKEG